MNTIILLGTREIKTDEFLEPQKDYGVFLVASRISEEKQDDDNDEIKYRLKVSHLDSIVDLKDNKHIQIKEGRTKSQKLRYMAECKLGAENYEPFMDYIISKFDELSDNYIESINK